MDLRERATAADRLRSARQAAYGPQGTPEARRRLRLLEAELDMRPPADAPAPITTPRAPRRRIAVAVAAAALSGALVGGSLVLLAAARMAPAPTRAAPALAAVSAQDELLHRIVEGDGVWSAADFYRLYPGALPFDWRDRSGVASASLRLTGTAAVPVHPVTGATSALVALTCPSADVRYTWVLRAADGGELGLARGLCGRLDPAAVPLPSGRGPFTVDVSISGTRGYAVAVRSR